MRLYRKLNKTPQNLEYMLFALVVVVVGGGDVLPSLCESTMLICCFNADVYSMRLKMMAHRFPSTPSVLLLLSNSLALALALRQSSNSGSIHDDRVEKAAIANEPHPFENP